MFVGTAVDSDFRTVRFRPTRCAGDMSQFASSGLVDVRYGIDAKYLDGAISTSSAPSTTRTSSRCASRVQPEAPAFGGDEVIGATESDLECPELVDPLRTMHTDGSSIDSGVLSPFFGNRDGLLRSSSSRSPSFARQCSLAAFRWFLTGFGRGVESIAKTSSTTPAARAADAPRPEPAGAGGRSIAPPVTSPLGLGGGDPGVLAQERRHDVVRATGPSAAVDAPNPPVRAPGSHAGAGTVIPNRSAALADMIRCLISGVNAG